MIRKIVREPSAVSGDLFVESMSRYSVQRGEIRIQHHSLATNHENPLFDVFDGREFRNGFLSWHHRSLPQTARWVTNVGSVAVHSQPMVHVLEQHGVDVFAG